MYFKNGDNGDIKVEDIRFDARDFDRLRGTTEYDFSKFQYPNVFEKWHNNEDEWYVVLGIYILKFYVVACPLAWIYFFFFRET